MRTLTRRLTWLFINLHCSSYAIKLILSLNFTGYLSIFLLQFGVIATGFSIRALLKNDY